MNGRSAVPGKLHYGSCRHHRASLNGRPRCGELLRYRIGKGHDLTLHLTLNCQSLDRGIFTDYKGIAAVIHMAVDRRGAAIGCIIDHGPFCRRLQGHLGILSHCPGCRCGIGRRHGAGVLENQSGYITAGQPLAPCHCRNRNHGAVRNGRYHNALSGVVFQGTGSGGGRQRRLIKGRFAAVQRVENHSPFCGGEQTDLGTDGHLCPLV